MESKILALLVIGVSAIVIIAVVVVYQFVQQQYDISQVKEDIQRQASEAKEDAYLNCKLYNTQQKCLNEYFK